MKVQHRRLGAAALTLVFCLALSPGASAGSRWDRDFDFRDGIVRIIKKIQKAFGVTVQEDFPAPPKP